jgi:hypothetical protein
MENIVMERSYASPLKEKGFLAMAGDLAGCLGLYRAQWQESFLAEDGRLLVCCFQAPDSESIRTMSRGDSSTYKSVWHGTVHDTARDGLASVVVERRFDTPVTVESLQDIEDTSAWCLEAHKVSFLRTYFSADQRNMICLYQAPDAESVRLAQQQAGMPFERVWACRHYTPDNISI